MLLRTCKKCGEAKLPEAFSKVPKCRDGLNPRCRKCVRKRQIERTDPEVLANKPRAKARALLLQGLKKCSRCDEIKPVAEFYRNNRFWNGLSAACKPCYKASWGVWKLENTGHLAQYNRAYRARPDVADRRTKDRRRRAADSPRGVMQITLAHGLRRRPTENPATLDDLMSMFNRQNGRCAISGALMTWSKGSVLPTSLSLDRIDPDGGYSAENLRLICHCVNAFRGRMSDDAMLSMARAIITHQHPPTGTAAGLLSFGA